MSAEKKQGSTKPDSDCWVRFSALGCGYLFLVVSQIVGYYPNFIVYRFRYTLEV